MYIKKYYFVLMATSFRPHEDQNIWNFVFSVFFLLVLIAALWEVWGEHGTFPHSVPLFDAVLMAFAAFRTTRLIVYDKITRWFRELFVERSVVEKEGEKWVELRPLRRGIRNTIHDLLGCPWCIGFWSALVISFGYFVFPWAWYVIFFLALAGAASLLQLTANMIGWKAENLKLEAHEREERVRAPIDLTSLGK